MIHAGEKNERAVAQMKSLLERVGLSEEETQIIWKEGKPVEVLHKVCQRENIDLLVLGAIRNEAFLRYYMGSIARKISRNPPCNLLLVTNPSKKSSRLNSIVVSGINHPKTANTIDTALEFSKQFEVKDISIVEEVKPTKVSTRINDEKSLEIAFSEKEALQQIENQRIQQILEPIRDKVDAVISQKCVFGKEGYSIGHFAEVKKADLLVMNSPDKKLGIFDRFFPHDLEYVLSDLPCDLMIVHQSTKS